MAEDYQIIHRPDGRYVAEVSARGRDVLRNHMINAGTAFTAAQRADLGLDGLLPPTVLGIDAQAARVYEQFQTQTDDLQKYINLSSLQARNCVLWAKTITDHLAEMLPIIYTPTVGRAIAEYSHWYIRPRGVYLDIDHPERIESSLLAYGKGSDEVDLIVATDSGAIWGIGDQGVGGVLMSAAKLAVYTGAAGIHPNRTMPIVLDVGTDNRALLADPGYLGLRHSRVRGEAYDAFLADFVTAVRRVFPNALLEWEDFAPDTATHVLSAYREVCCTFNDDIQGSAALVDAAIWSALSAHGERLTDQRIVIDGAGSAGVGIAHLLHARMVELGLSPADARARLWALDAAGLLVEGDPMRDYQAEFARPRADVAAWGEPGPGGFTLAQTVARVHPTVLIGTSGQGGAFTREIVRQMAADCEHPIILPLSNPRENSEANPADLVAWSDGRALVAWGSGPAVVEHDGVAHHIAWANNALVFPGIGLGALSCFPATITDATGTTTASDTAISLLRFAAMMMPPTHNIGARRKNRIMLLRKFCTCVTSLVMRVMSEARSNLSTFSSDSSCTRV